MVVLKVRCPEEEMAFDNEECMPSQRMVECSLAWGLQNKSLNSHKMLNYIHEIT